jgi:hypothetical protein
VNFLMKIYGVGSGDDGQNLGRGKRLKSAA